MAAAAAGVRAPNPGSAAEAGLDHSDELLRRLRLAVQVLGGSCELLADLGRTVAAAAFHPDQNHADDDAGYQENRDHGDEDDGHVYGLSLLSSFCCDGARGRCSLSDTASAQAHRLVEEAPSD